MRVEMYGILQYRILGPGSSIGFIGDQYEKSFSNHFPIMLSTAIPPMNKIQDAVLSSQ
jgi:hypothetical protein